MNTHNCSGPREVSNLNHQCVNSLTPTFSVPAELPPQPPRACFGRDELIERIFGLADKFSPIALIGAGGIGKTSIALTVLHDNRIKERFGDNRRFMRCDQFPATPGHFLRRLSEVIGAGVEDIEDLTPLRSFLASEEMFIVLDNAESILDPQGPSAQEIYAIVEELSRFKNLCICITSRISTIPPDYKVLDIPTLSMDAARETFYRIYGNDKRSDPVDKILEQLDFHPLSITLLATVAHHNKWDIDRVTREWESQRTAVLQTDHKQSLAATIELSLASPLFKELGPYARALLEVAAFFPQGINEDNFDWLFPTIPNGRNIFDKFCVLSLTHRSGNFVTMLAPIRDYIYPKDPLSSPLLYITKERYCSRLLMNDNTDFGETRWIMSEDVNVEHLLGIFTSVDSDSDNVWEACANFASHLSTHKPRPVTLLSQIEGLPDNHPSKLRCLHMFSRLLAENYSGRPAAKRLLVHILKLNREWACAHRVAATLRSLAEINRHLDHGQGILQLKEALEIYEQYEDAKEQKETLYQLAMLYVEDWQLDLGEETASRAANLFPDGPCEYDDYEFHHILGHACESRGETEAAISHLEIALEITSSRGWETRQIRIHDCLVTLFLKEERFNDAQVHLENLKLIHSTHGAPICVDQLMIEQASVWFAQGRFEEAKSEFLRIIGVYDGGVHFSECIEDIKVILQIIEVGTKGLVISD